MIQTAERVSHNDLSDNYVYQRSLLAYLEAAKLVNSKVLEIGTGSGYGVELISGQAEEFVTIDKFELDPIAKDNILNVDNVSFIKMTVPPLAGIEDNTFDYVISFQVIEHIVDERLFVNEIHRVLKPGGKFIVTTPNKKMSLTRNPWHIREYTTEELNTLLLKDFIAVNKKGVFGNEKIMNYFHKNKESVRRITKFDIFNLQYRLPRQLLQIPYDLANRLNRRLLLKENTDLVSNISTKDYYLADVNENCFDLFYIAEK